MRDGHLYPDMCEPGESPEPTAIASGESGLPPPKMCMGIAPGLGRPRSETEQVARNRAIVVTTERGGSLEVK